MKGVKTSTSLQVGDILTVKTGGIVYSYAGETGNTDKDTAYAGDYLGVAQKISGSSVVFKGSDGIVRNSVSIGDMSYAANPDFDYATGGTGGNSGTGGIGGDSRSIWEKGLDSLLKIVSIFTGTGSTPTANNGGESDGQNKNNNSNGNNNNNNNNNGSGQDKTFIQKYGIYGLILAIIGVVITLIVKKPKPVQPQNTYQAPQFPQQYQSVKF